MGGASTTSTAAPRNKSARQPRLREASFRDYEQIIQLESRYGLGALESRSYDKWSHLWLGNPLYRELQAGWSIGWVLEDPSGKIVGSMANIPLPYEFEGKRIVAATGRAWVVETEYRAASLMLLDRVINQRGIDLYINNSVGTTSLGGVQFFNCLHVPAGAWDESRFWITSHQGFVERVLSMKKYPLAKPLSYPLSAAASVHELITRSRLRSGGVELAECPGFDDRFDEFWEQLRRKNPNLLLAVRSREMLEWHFRRTLLENRLWIVTAVKGARLAGWAIFARADNQKLGFTRVQLVDFESLAGDAALLIPMLAWAANKCSAERIHMLEIPGWYPDEKDVIRRSSWGRKLSNWTFFYRAINPGLGPSLAEAKAWAPSLFDGDASL